MASFAAQAELRSKWTDLVDFEVPGEVTSGVRSIVGWLKQASLEVQQAGVRTLNALARPGTGLSPTMESSLTILHYNDVYNVESSKQEPVGGAARFCTAIKSFAHLNPLVLFSGDIFSPSILSTYTKGDQMLPVLKEVGTQCAVFGNHDFDFGLEKLRELILQTELTWLMSNVIDQETGRPLGEGQITHVVQWGGKRIGLIGLVEQEWLDTLNTVNPDEVIFLNYIEVGTKLGAQLKQEGCDLVIALTHMRTPNDIRLATNCNEIDLILGGHDHVYEKKLVNGKWIIKSGTDFKHFSKITLSFGLESNSFDIDIEKIEVTSKYEEDIHLKGLLENFSSIIESKMDDVLGTFAVPLDGRFQCVRTQESNLGNWVCDVILAATGADLVIINSGTLRSDRIHPPGEFTIRDLTSIIPMMDLIVLIEVSGEQILAALENSVSMYPKLEGRFPQVAGMSFGFDPDKPVGQRVDPRFVRIGDEYLELDQDYRLATKVYLYDGRDGFTMLKDTQIVQVDEDECPDIARAIQNHFQAIDIRLGKKRHSKHRQSLVTLSRRHSLVKLLDSSGVELDGPAPIRRRTSTLDMDHTPPGSAGSAGSSPHSGIHGPGSHKGTKTRMTRRASLVDLEQDSCELKPKVEGRIVILDDEKRKELMLERERLEASSVIMEAEEYSGPNEGTDPI